MNHDPFFVRTCCHPYIKLEDPAWTRFLNPHYFGFFVLYCQTDENFVFEGMICSLMLRNPSGSTFSNSSRTASIIGLVLTNLSFLSILILQYCRSCWKQLPGITSAIGEYLSSHAQHCLYNDNNTTSIFIKIPISDKISENFVFF